MFPEHDCNHNKQTDNGTIAGSHHSVLMAQPAYQLCMLSPSVWWRLCLLSPTKPHCYWRLQLVPFHCAPPPPFAKPLESSPFPAMRCTLYTSPFLCYHFACPHRAWEQACYANWSLASHRHKYKPCTSPWTSDSLTWPNGGARSGMYLDMIGK